MNDRNPLGLDTPFAKLVVNLTMSALKSPSGVIGDPAEAADYFAHLAEELIRVVQDRSARVAAEARRVREEMEAAAQADREALVIEWVADPTDGNNRAGAHWSALEVSALAARFRHGARSEELCRHHKRSHTAIQAQLIKHKLLVEGHHGCYHHPETGREWSI